jgi:GNAT superfamily N-acetyltransferase
MKIVDLNEEHVPLYCLCLEDWSADISEAGDHKARWFEKFKDRGLRVKLALDDRGEVGGMIQYLPIERSTAQGEGLYMIQCVWVHGHKQGRGNFQKKGMGKALLEAAEKDAKDLGAVGMAAWGLLLPFWMKASWFRKHGYRQADRDGMAALVWKPFAKDAKPPRFIKLKKKPEKKPGVVTITAFKNGWCPAQNLTYERARRASVEFGNKVDFETIDTSDRTTMMEWGISDAVLIDGKQVGFGPPPSYQKIRKLIEARVRKLK